MSENRTCNVPGFLGTAQGITVVFCQQPHGHVTEDHMALVHEGVVYWSYGDATGEAGQRLGAENRCREWLIPPEGVLDLTITEGAYGGLVCKTRDKGFQCGRPGGHEDDHVRKGRTEGLQMSWEMRWSQKKN